MTSRIPPEVTDEIVREVQLWTAEQRLNAEREAHARRGREAKQEEEDREMKRKELEIREEEMKIKREELELKRGELEFKRQEAEVRKKNTLQERLFKDYDWDVQVYLAELAAFEEQKKQYMADRDHTWVSDSFAARNMGRSEPRRPTKPW